MTDKAVTLSDIAKKLNVSTVTVSKALRGHPDISPKTTKLIKKVAEEVGYTPNLVARKLSARKSNTIGVVVPKIAHFFFGSIIEHIYNKAFDNGYEILLTVSQESSEREKKHIQTLLAMKVDGILISLTQETRDYEIFETVRKRGVPIVFMDRTPDMKSVNTVTVDDYGGALKAVEHLINIGYTKIGHFAGYTNINIGRLRRQGFYDAMKKHNLPIKKEWVIEGGYGEQHGYDSFMELYKANNLPEVVFTVTYPVALGVYMAASEVGIKIPNDIDVICFGNAKMQNLLSPPLSCVDQPTDQIAEKSMDLLISNINDADNLAPHSEVIQTELIIRGTCVQTEVIEDGSENKKVKK